MPKVREVCRFTRSKNAGPFWITLDLWFRDAASFDRYAHVPPLQPEAVAALYGTTAHLVKHVPIKELLVLKISYPRRSPQGGAFERDMHGGQQYVRLLNVELDQ